MAPSEGQFHASGIVLQHYAEPDKVTGLCLPSWRVTSSSIVYSPTLASGTATKVTGELYVRGDRACKFQADVATISAVSHPSSVLQVLGNLEVSEKTTGATLHCKLLTWEAGSQILRLGGPDGERKRLNTIPARLQLGLRTVGAKNRIFNLEGEFAALDGKMMSPLQGSNQHAHSSLLDELCHAHVNIPATYLTSIDFSFNLKSWARKKLCAVGAVFGRIMKKTFCCSSNDSFAILTAKGHNVCSARMNCSKETSQKNPGYIEVIVNAEEGMNINLASGRISSPGFLSLSCPALHTEVQAGGGEVYLNKDTSVYLHRGVSAKVQGFKLQAQRLYFSSNGDRLSEGDNRKLTKLHIDSLLGPTEQLRVAKQEYEMHAKIGEMKGLTPSAVSRFKTKLSDIYYRSPGLVANGSCPPSLCHFSCYAKCGSYGSSRIILRKNNHISNLRGIVQVLCKQILSALHVSLRPSQIRNYVGMQFEVSQWFTSTTKLMVREDINQEDLLAAFEKVGAGLLVAEGDVRMGWW